MLTFRPESPKAAAEGREDAAHRQPNYQVEIPSEFPPKIIYKWIPLVTDVR